MFKVSTQSLMHRKHSVHAKESHPIPSFPHLVPEPPFFPSGRPVFSQLGLTTPLTGGLECKPELEELTKDHKSYPESCGSVKHRCSSLARCQDRDRLTLRYHSVTSAEQKCAWHLRSQSRERGVINPSFPGKRRKEATERR